VSRTIFAKTKTYQNLLRETLKHSKDIKVDLSRVKDFPYSLRDHKQHEDFIFAR
jgi:hypothetical protein